jgi:hypothetical protein
LPSVKVEFTHPLDSHCLLPGSSDPNEAGDVGQFSKLPNGDDLEVGEMAAPHLEGKITPYEEIWRTVNLDSSPSPDDGLSQGARGWILEGVGGGKGEMVFYARVRGFFLAVQRTTETHAYQYSALREDFDDVLRRWKRVYTVGDVRLLMSMSEMPASSNDMESAKKWALEHEVIVRSGQRCLVRAVEY